MKVPGFPQMTPVLGLGVWAFDLGGLFHPSVQDVKQQAEAALAMGMDRHGLKNALGGGGKAEFSKLAALILG